MDVPNELNIVCFMFADFATEWGLFPINGKKKAHYRHQVYGHQAYGHQVYGVIRTSNKRMKSIHDNVTPNMGHATFIRRIV